MFQRILHEDWASIVPMISFGLLAAVFLATTCRAVRLAPAERERLAALPLDEKNLSEPPSR